MPTIDENGKFNAKNTENEGPFDEFEFEFDKEIEGIRNMKDTDNNYETDYNTLVELAYAGMPEMFIVGENYWIPSRITSSSSTPIAFVAFNLCFMGEDDLQLHSDRICMAYSGGGTVAWVYSQGLRPVISLNTNVKVIAGDGETEATAYELGL